LERAQKTGVDGIGSRRFGIIGGEDKMTDILLIMAYIKKLFKSNL